MVVPTATESAVSGLADFLFLPRPEVLYLVVVALFVFGVTFWILGHQIHRIFLSVLLLTTGLAVAWQIAIYYELEGLHAVLAILAGGLLGTGLGYWFFRFWLGLLASALMAVVLFLLYSGSFALPYLQTAAAESQAQLTKELKLRPGAHSSVKKIPVSTTAPASVGKNLLGQAYWDLRAALPRLSRAKYPDWKTWRESFPTVLQTVWTKLLVIIPRLAIDVFLISGVAVIFGFVLTVIRPVFLDIGYTSLLGLMLILSGVLVLLTLNHTEQLQWLGENILITVGVVAGLWLAGVGFQYRMVPPPPPPEDSEDGEEGGEKDKGQDKKKK